MACPAEPLYLALDQGGHSSRALVFSKTGELITLARADVTTAQPYPGWVEQDARTLIDSLQTVIHQVRRTLGRDWKRLHSAGLATQRSNCLCWDRADATPLSPALSWQDRRAQDWLASHPLDHAWLRARTGLLPSPHYGAGKLRWCLDHLPAVRAAAADQRLAMGPLAAYLARRLTDAPSDSVDPANAARSLLWNLADRDWDTALLAHFGIAREWLPESVPTCHDYGQLQGVPLRILSGDQSAALYAGGAPDPTCLSVNLGTGAFLQRPLRAFSPPPEGLLGSIVYADAQQADYVLEATVNGAGTAFDWARDQLGIRDIEARLPDWLQQAGDVPLFLNGIAGLGSPWWRADFASRFVGPGTPAAQAVAVAESIVFLILANLERLRAAGPLRTIRVSGGLAQLDGLCQRLADLSGLSVQRAALPEATARGLAWLLVRAAGHAEAWPMPAVQTFAPQNNPACARRYDAWRGAMQDALGRLD